uniref:Dual specificity protein phosphatase n=1 Tax=Sinocyclocheilus anshuiensis TaxID=1608454 RepID=A0A671PFE1_9TELE
KSFQKNRVERIGIPAQPDPEPSLQWTPVTEVWPSVFIGNEETAMDRVKLKEMGITHILNTVAYKEYLQGKIDTKAEYYQEMNITYYGVLVMDEHRFDISKDLFPASEFIHKALNRLLVHCIDGVSRSATFFLAYLMIHHEMLLEDAIDHVIDKRWIRPNRDFLNIYQLCPTVISCLRMTLF